MKDERYYVNCKDGKSIPLEENMLSRLLDDGVLFCNTRKFLDIDKEETPRENTIVLFVNCNDTFAWGCADAESLTTAELPDLFEEHLKNQNCGSTRWVCKKRNMKPQAPMVEYLKQNGGWDESMESLPDNEYDKLLKEKYKNENNL